jgi:hypothetical protein
MERGLRNGRRVSARLKLSLLDAGGNAGARTRTVALAS